jgi:transposase InsO family protein
MSERRACRVIGADRASVRYQATRPDDGALRERLKALAQERRRFGYRRLHVLLRREGQAVNRKRVQRIYREERLTVRRRGGRKRAMGTRAPIETPLAANQRWSLDFVSDQMSMATELSAFMAIQFSLARRVWQGSVISRVRNLWWPFRAVCRGALRPVAG